VTTFFIFFQVLHYQTEGNSVFIIRSLKTVQN